MIVQTAAARSSVPYHFAVPFSYAMEDAVASVEGRTSESSELLTGFASTDIALFRAASDSENDVSSSLLRTTFFAFDVV